MNAQTHSRLLNYLVCELAMPTKKHVYNFSVSDQTSMNPQLISAAALIAKTQVQKLPQQPIMAGKCPKRKDIDSSGTSQEIKDTISSHEIELCEGTEIEKSALGEILHYANDCKQSETKQKPRSTCISISDNQGCEILDIAKEDNGVGSHSEPKRRRYSAKEDKPANCVLVEGEDKISNYVGGSTKCSEGTETSSALGGSYHIDSNNSVHYSDPMLLCSDSDFKTMFGVSRSTFQILVEMLAEEELEPIEDVPLYKKVLIVLWLLGTSDSYKDVAQVFEISEEAVSSCFFDICATLYNKSENFIKWPSSGESDEIASRVETKFGFPGVVGVLGCNYFTISIPKETLSRREHFNGKLRMYCVGLQLVCDDELVIRDIFPGMPGGIPPAQMLRDSPIGDILTTQPTELIDPNKHILARSEFPQLTSMLTPYTKHSESLTKDEEEFNFLHENVCLLVDQTFKMLKDRFRILKLLDPEVATMVIVTTCVLHNICIQNGDLHDLEERT